SLIEYIEVGNKLRKRNITSPESEQSIEVKIAKKRPFIESRNIQTTTKRNESNYSVQPDEFGQGRGKTSSRSGKSSSRKTYLEDARVSPHSPRPEEKVGNSEDLEKKGLVVSTSSKPDTEVSKYKPKGPQKKQRGPKNNKGKGKSKANWHRPYPQGYRIPKLEPSAIDSVFNMARTFMEFTAKEKERINRTFPHKL
ncbi:hypothetical protein O181_116658, partial [Austropuccinia psidii MF-1]|nr:hypothetical protein [Austropuccinia psidii MF-1]